MYTGLAKLYQMSFTALLAGRGDTYHNPSIGEPNTGNVLKV